MGNNAVIKAKILNPINDLVPSSPDNPLPTGGASITALQIRRDTKVSDLTETYSTIAFNLTDVETNNSVISYDGVNTITAEETGIYEINFHMDLSAPPLNYITEFSGRITKNGNPIVGSSALASTFYDNAVAGGIFKSHLGKSFLTQIDAGFTIQFQSKVKAIAGSATASILPNALIIMKKIAT